MKPVWCGGATNARRKNQQSKQTHNVSERTNDRTEFVSIDHTFCSPSVIIGIPLLAAVCMYAKICDWLYLAIFVAAPACACVCADLTAALWAPFFVRRFCLFLSRFFPFQALKICYHSVEHNSACAWPNQLRLITVT